MAGKEKILVVDDEKRMLRVLRLGLGTAGYQVTTASDGDEALEKLLEFPFDLVVTDVKMANMSGVELIYEIERLGMKIPVVVMTAFADVETAVKVFKHGAYDFIQKPFTLEELEHTIRQTLKRSAPVESPAVGSLQESVEEKEKEMIVKAFRKSADNKALAAKLLNISERTLWYKVKKYNL